MRILTTVIAVLLLMQSTVRAEEPWRFITLADWHGAEMYVQPNSYPGGVEKNLAGLKMLKENYGGELVMLPGDSNRGHWDTRFFIYVRRWVCFGGVTGPSRGDRRPVCHGHRADA